MVDRRAGPADLDYATNLNNSSTGNRDTALRHVVLDDGTGVIVGSTASPLPIGYAPLTAGTGRSGSITTGGTAQTLAVANTARVSLTGVNIDPTNDLWINEEGGTAAANTAGSWPISPRTGFAVSTNRTISIVGAVTGQKFTATET